MGLIDENTEGRKSRATVPLRPFYTGRYRYRNLLKLNLKKRNRAPTLGATSASFKNTKHNDLPEVKNLERREHGVISNAALKPKEERAEGEENKGGPVEEAHGTEHPNGQDKLEVVRRNELTLLLNLHPLPHCFSLGVLGLDQLL
jgi:hypothetical protein